MQNGNMCYASVDGPAPRQLPSLWHPDAETPLPAKSADHGDDSSISMRIFGKPVTCITCGGPGVSQALLDHAFAE